MFHPSIKKENLIIKEDNLEDSKKEIKKQAVASSLHRTEKEYEEQKKKREKGKKISHYSRRPVTRRTTKSASVSESIFKVTDVVNDERNDVFP